MILQLGTRFGPDELWGRSEATGRARPAAVATHGSPDKRRHVATEDQTSLRRPAAYLCSRLEISVWYGRPSSSARFWIASRSLC
jgi:hypothetical protein